MLFKRKILSIQIGHSLPESFHSDLLAEVWDGAPVAERGDGGTKVLAERYQQIVVFNPEFLWENLPQGHFRFIRGFCFYQSQPV